MCAISWNKLKDFRKFILKSVVEVIPETSLWHTRHSSCGVYSFLFFFYIDRMYHCVRTLMRRTDIERNVLLPTVTKWNSFLDSRWSWILTHVCIYFKDRNASMLMYHDWTALYGNESHSELFFSTISLFSFNNFIFANFVSIKTECYRLEAFQELFLFVKSLRRWKVLY